MQNAASSTSHIDEQMLEMFRDVVTDDFSPLITKYLAMAETMLAAIETANNANDILALTRTAHSLGSSSHQLGALQMKSLLAQIEVDAEKMDQAKRTALVENVKQEFSGVKSYLTKVI